MRGTSTSHCLFAWLPASPLVSKAAISTSSAVRELLRSAPASRLAMRRVSSEARMRKHRRVLGAGLWRSEREERRLEGLRVWRRSKYRRRRRGNEVIRRQVLPVVEMTELSAVSRVVEGPDGAEYLIKVENAPRIGLFLATPIRWLNTLRDDKSWHVTVESETRRRPGLSERYDNWKRDHPVGRARGVNRVRRLARPVEPSDVTSTAIRVAALADVGGGRNGELGGATQRIQAMPTTVMTTTRKTKRLIKRHR